MRRDTVWYSGVRRVKGLARHRSILMGRFHSEGETFSEGVGREIIKEMKERQN